MSKNTIALPEDEFVSFQKQIKESKKKFIKVQFTNDNFKTKLFMEKDKMMAEDSNGKAEVVILNHDLMKGFKPISAKGEVIHKLLEAGFSIDEMLDMTNNQLHPLIISLQDAMNKKDENKMNSIRHFVDIIIELVKHKQNKVNVIISKK